MNSPVQNQEPAAETGELGATRRLTGVARAIQYLVLSTIPVSGVLYVFGAHHWAGVTLYTEQYVGLLLTLMLVGVFMSYPAHRGAPRDRLPIMDMILCLTALPVGLYITILYPDIAHRLGQITTIRVGLAFLCIALVLEAVRRVIGWPLLLVVVVIILYARFAAHFPGLLQGRSMSWQNLANYMYLDPNSILSMLQLGGTIGLAFVLLGQVLLLFGGGQALINLATAVFGRFIGGASKVSVVSSSLFGSVTGAPMANVILTGSFTIPLMKKFHYPARTAGAVEAVASTGGQILPPVMGIAGFLIAENLRIPYAEVALAALIPALLFYISLFLFTDLEARKLGVPPLTRDQYGSLAPAAVQALPTIICFAVLTYLIFFVRLGVASAGVITSLLAVGLLLLPNRNYRRLLSLISQTLEGTGRMLLSVCVALSAAGLVVGAISISGIGFVLTQAFSALGEQSFALLLLLTAGTTIILGMGMPTVAAYALVAVLMAPGLVSHGVPPLSAHLFVLYYAVLSNITPPIALASFAAAPIAGEHPTRVAVESVRIGVVAFLVPVAFVLQPALILQGSAMEVAQAAMLTLTGVLLITIAAVGHLLTAFNMLERAALFAMGAALLAPSNLLGEVSLLLPVVLGAAILLRRVMPAIRERRSKRAD